jgi:GH43 family beta-xylosidase/arylsulfatase A-like enzyme
MYFAADDGSNDNHRLYVIENASADPMQGEWVFKGQITDDTNKWAIDGSVFTHKGQLYFIWSGWEGDKNGQQDLYIARMKDPCTIEGKRVKIASPQYKWEKMGDLHDANNPPHINVNEGPELLVHDNKLFLIYSASACWTDDYALGMLTASADADLLDPASWKKHPKPVFKKSETNSVYAPGHNSFFRSPDGKEDWILYHANPAPGCGCGGKRSPRMQKFTWNKDGTPNFGIPVKEGTELAVPSMATAQAPNIVIIMADDLDSKQLSCYGGKNIVTKNIDALAGQGMKFNQMIASEAMCVPTRASLFTGLYPARHGSFQNHKPVSSDSMKSICHFMGNLGYTVALTGKDHSTKPASVFPFEILKGFEPNCVAATDDYEFDEIKQFITKKDRNPYCLFIMSTNPHVPWTMGDPSEFDPAKLVLPDHWVDTKQTRGAFTKYLAEIRRLDNQVGDVMKLLQETGQDQNTIFIFLGEQGPQLPGGKWNLWDNGQKSSMIVRWPGKVRPGTETQAIIQYEDITPTLVDLAGGAPASGLDGKSFLQVLLEKNAMHRDYAYGIHNNIPEGPAYPIRDIRDNRYKLILNLMPEKDYHNRFMMNPKDKNLWYSWLQKAEIAPEAKKLTDRIVKRPPVEFYDLEKDPYELNNLANDPAYQQKVIEYTVKLKAWMKQQGDSGADMDK